MKFSIFTCTCSCLTHLFVVWFNIFCLQSFECFSWYICYQCVQFVCWIFIIVSSTGQTNTYTEWCAPANQLKNQMEAKTISSRKSKREKERVFKVLFSLLLLLFACYKKLTGYLSTKCACSSEYRYEHHWCASPFRQIYGFLWWRVGHAFWNRYCVRVSTNGWYIRGSQLRWSPIYFSFQLLVWPFLITGYWTSRELTYTIEHHWHVVCCAKEEERKREKEKKHTINIYYLWFNVQKFVSESNFLSNLNAIMMKCIEYDGINMKFAIVKNHWKINNKHFFLTLVHNGFAAIGISIKPTFLLKNHSNIDEIYTNLYSSNIFTAIAFKIDKKLFKINWMICDLILIILRIHTSQ